MLTSGAAPFLLACYPMGCAEKEKGPTFAGPFFIWLGSLLLHALIAFPDLVGFGELGQVAEPGMAGEVLGRLLELAAVFLDGRNDVLDVAFKSGGDSVVGGLLGEVHGLQAELRGAHERIEGRD